MATNLEKLKDEIAEMDAFEFTLLMSGGLCNKIREERKKTGLDCWQTNCCECVEGWLNEEAKE